MCRGAALVTANWEASNSSDATFQCCGLTFGLGSATSCPIVVGGLGNGDGGGQLGVTPCRTTRLFGAQSMHRSPVQR